MTARRLSYYKSVTHAARLTQRPSRTCVSGLGTQSRVTTTVKEEVAQHAEKSSVHFQQDAFRSIRGKRRKRSQFRDVWAEIAASSSFPRAKCVSRPPATPPVFSTADISLSTLVVSVSFPAIIDRTLDACMMDAYNPVDRNRLYT